MNALYTDSLRESLDEIEFLIRSDHRVMVLTSLSEGPLDRTDLRAATGASSPTMGRILTDLQARRWLHRDGPTYRLTHLGEYVVDRIVEFSDAMTAERKLRDVWQWLPREMDGFTVDLFADAVVSYPGPGYPYEPVERVARLIEESSSVRGFGTLELKTANIETMCGAVLDGLEMEYVFSPVVLETALAWNADLIVETAAAENCTLLVHDALPDEDRCGLTVVDGRTAICCHDAGSRTLRAVVDTAAPEARAWGLGVFERYRREATPVDGDSVESVVSKRAA